MGRRFEEGEVVGSSPRTPSRRAPWTRAVVPCVALVLMVGSTGCWRPGATGSDVGPVGRVGHGAVYHPGLRMVVVFGGRDSTGTDLNDLWGWDGTEWRLLDDGRPGPPPRARHAMAFDAARGRIVVQGGGGVESDLGDTWTWTEDGWTEWVGPGPGPRSHHAMAYDPGSGTVLLYGGGRDAEGFGRDLWRLDADGWTRHGEGPRPGRVLPAMASTDEGVLLYGGLIRGGPRSSELWAWRGGRWSLLAGPGPPGALSPGLVWNGAADRALLFGGETEEGLLEAAWIWADGVWGRLEDQGSPPARTDHVLVRDPHRGRAVVFGGRGADAVLGDLWEFDGVAWARR